MLPFYHHHTTVAYRDVEQTSPWSSVGATNKSMAESSSREGRSISASKSHSEAERRRRERINTHLATLRSLLPNTRKTDKASLLAEVIAHVKELKRNAVGVGLGSASGPVPSEADEVTVDPDPCSPLIKASLCCDDRPDLLSDLTRTLRAMRVRAIKAEISTVGGRVKNVFLIQPSDFSHQSLPSLRHALRSVMDKPAPGSKRPRLAHLIRPPDRQ